MRSRFSVDPARLLRFLLPALLGTTLIACGGSSGGGSSGGTTTSIAAKASVETLTGLVDGEVRTSGFTATAVHIHENVTDGVLITLVQDATDTELWTTPDGAKLTAAQLDLYRSGGLYYQAHSVANPTGEAREDIPAQTVTSNLSVDTNTGTVTGTVTVTGIDDATAAHIHVGAAGDDTVSGNIAIDLERVAGSSTAWQPAAGQSLDQSEIDAYQAGKTFVVVHSPDYPTGHARLQLVPSGVQVLAVHLSGDERVPPAVTDATATGYVTIEENTGTISAVLKLHNIDDSTNAHIHDGLAGIDGGGVTQGAAGSLGFTGSPGDVVWTMAESDAGASLASILAGETYLNVHTNAVGSGEIRGQIVPEGVTVARVVTSAADAQAAGTNSTGTSAGSAVGYVTVDANASPATIRANVFVEGVTPTVAHVHGPAVAPALNGPFIVTLATSGQANCNAAGLCAGPGTDTLDAGQLTQFQDGEMYINVHTAGNPAGELRGQVVP